jgi:hypothetical protein
MILLITSLGFVDSQSSSNKFYVVGAARHLMWRVRGIQEYWPSMMLWWYHKRHRRCVIKGLLWQNIKNYDVPKNVSSQKTFNYAPSVTLMIPSKHHKYSTHQILVVATYYCAWAHQTIKCATGAPIVHSQRLVLTTSHCCGVAPDTT